MELSLYQLNKANKQKKKGAKKVRQSLVQAHHKSGIELRASARATRTEREKSLALMRKKMMTNWGTI